MPKGGKNRSQAAGKSKEDVERKRDERARRNALKKEREVKEYLENDENFVSFSNQLQAVGYKIKDIKGDGNCLFRALADQLEGDDSVHLKHRRIIARYLADHREQFEPFIEDNKSFDEHVKELSKPGTFGGNDSIVAFSRNHGVNIIIHQLNEPCWVIQGEQYASSRSGLKELHISYHNGDHYSSVRRIHDPDNGPAWEFNNKNVKVKDKNGEYPYKNAKTKEPENYCTGAEASPKESSDIIIIIKAATGCEDSQLIQQTLADSNYDMDATISYLLQLQSVIEVEEPAQTSPVELLSDMVEGTEQENNKVPDESSVKYEITKQSTSTGTRPKVKQPNISSSKRKQLAKQEKKERRMEKQREEAQEKHVQNLGNLQVDQNLPFIGDLEALSI